MGSSQSKKGPNFQATLIQIKIEINSVLIWEKIYNIEETFEQIYKDFISEKNYVTGISIKWFYNKKNIEFNSTTLSKFIQENNLLDISTLEINQEIIFGEGTKEEIVEYCDYFAVPFFNPFSLLIYDKQKNSLKKKKFKEDIINNQIKFGIESAYCNGGNHFFIFGGFYSSNEEQKGILFDFDLIEENIKNQILISPQKRNHSMIYSEKKVYIVGGNEEKTSYYDSEEKEIKDMGNLNIKRFEPSLIRHLDYLYCFDSSRKSGDKFSFEKINLNKIPNSSWEIIYPQISPLLGSNNVYNQKFFGIVKDSTYNIIFFGGLYDNYSEDNLEPQLTIYNNKYNLLTNTMEKSDIPFEEISLNEKTFLPLDEKTNFILWNNNNIKKPKMIKFFKNENKFEIEELKFEEKSQEKKLYKTNFYPNLQKSLIGINLDMPETSSRRIKGKSMINDNYNINGILIKGQENNNYEINDNDKNYNNNGNINNLNIKNEENYSNHMTNEDNENKNKGLDINFTNNEITPNTEVNNINVNKKDNIIIDVNSNEKNNTNFKNNDNTDIDKKPVNEIEKTDGINNDSKKNDDNNNQIIANINVTPNNINNENLNTSKHDEIPNANKENNNNNPNVDIIKVNEIAKNDTNNNQKENIKNEEYKNDEIDIFNIDQKQLNKIVKSNDNKFISKKDIKREGRKIMKKNLYYFIDNNY